MKYIVELFDGRTIRGLRMDKKQMSELLARVDQLDPALGVIVLDITPESHWTKGKRQVETGHPMVLAGVDRDRHTSVDRMMV